MKGITPRLALPRLIKIGLLAAAALTLNGCLEYQISGSVSPEDFISQCQDNIDNDMDGWFDEEDPDCLIESATAELGFGSSICNDGLDNDGDAHIDASDSKCSNAITSNETITSGDVVISEFMANPSVVSDTYGEWIELYNNSDEIINLKNWSVQNSKSTVVINSDVYLPSYSYIVISRGADTVNGLSGTKGTSFVYGSSLSLSNSGDSIRLTDATGTVITAIAYTSSDVKDGFSTVVNGELFPVELNVFMRKTDAENADNWCFSSAEATYGSGDKGSPGSMNSYCH